MHTEANNFIEEIKSFFPYEFKNRNVLDCGSLDLNGNNRKYFTDSNYFGIDIFEGKNVDKVITIADYLKGTDQEYDFIISTETLEHDENWEEDIHLMVDHIKKTKGSLLVTCAGPKRAEHMTPATSPPDHPWVIDFYKNHDIDLFDFIETIPVARYGRGRSDVYFFIQA